QRPSALLAPQQLARGAGVRWPEAPVAQRNEQVAAALSAQLGRQVASRREAVCLQEKRLRGDESPARPVSPLPEQVLACRGWEFLALFELPLPRPLLLLFALWLQLPQPLQHRQGNESAPAPSPRHPP